MTRTDETRIDAKLHLIAKSGDIAELKKLFGRLCLDENDPTTTFVLTRLLGIASVTAGCRALHSDFMKELIARVAPCCDIFYLLSLVRIEAGIGKMDSSLVPKHIRDAIHTRSLGTTIGGHSIKRLGRVSFGAFIGYVLDEGSGPIRLRSELNAPILRQVYRYNLVSDSVLLALMGLSILKPPRPGDMESVESILD